MRESGTVLVVDDDPMFRALLVEVFEREGYTVHEATEAQEALGLVESARPEVMLLDLSLGTSSGFDVLRQVDPNAGMGIIVISGHSAEADRVAALELGADDYVPKPIMARELVARVRALTRRVNLTPEIDLHAAPEPLVFGRLTVDRAAREAAIDGASAHLTAKEFDLLHFLASSPRRVYSRQQILDEVWGSAEWRSPGTVSEHIRRVRLKLAELGSQHDWITTLKGAGYRFEPEQDAMAPNGSARAPVPVPNLRP